MKAILILHEKKLLLHKRTNDLAIAEIKIWRVLKSKHYGTGIKYSLYLVHNGVVLLGFDNHKPKGPHFHIDGKEIGYIFISNQKLLYDFWELVKKKGYRP